ncbi:MAG: ribonuclease PH [bacterium]
MIKRPDGRTPAQIRPIQIHQGYVPHAEGSCLLSMGKTKVLCVASVEQRVPPFLQGKGSGWVTADYAMLPRAGAERSPRQKVSKGGRSQEIQRLIGRALRAVVNLQKLGEYTITLDCDVITADGGTRTASINGAYIALIQALKWMQKKKLIKKLPLEDTVGAISIGLMDNTPLVDLCYEEDKNVRMDLNVVLTGKGKVIEVQGTSEGKPCSRAEFDRMLTQAGQGIRQVIAHIKRHVK